MKKIISYSILFFSLAISASNVYAKQNFDDQASIENSYINHRQNVQLKDSGKIERILPDDTQGSRHQKFIVRINASITVLIAHNIDIAKRIPNLKEGDRIEFYGEYSWNKNGGVVHWTHRDPSGRHLAGWLKYKGIVYQ